MWTLCILNGQKDYAGLVFGLVKLQGIFKELKERASLYVMCCLLCFVDELLVHLKADIYCTGKILVMSDGQYLSFCFCNANLSYSCN